MSKVIYLSHQDAAHTRVATEVRIEMARIGIKEAPLARLAGITQPTLNRRLNPKSEADAFSVAELERIADVLGVAPAVFFRSLGKNSGGDGPDGTTPAGAPTRARTWDLRIIRPTDTPFASVELDTAA